MQDMRALSERFPARELEVRRLCARDESFRCACEDYEVAVKAIRHWEFTRNNMARAIEYRQLANEIAAEIEASLDATSNVLTTQPNNKGVHR